MEYLLLYPQYYKSGPHEKWDMDPEDASLDEGSLRPKEMDADLEDEVGPDLAMDELNQTVWVSNTSIGRRRVKKKT
ncbi:hypothetical protein PIB30_040948 [Stylosanthes scabra]|uniref:Uncharacterized protein n=1 Tax=Stylosanthes scabra TaxID=79078 RepID=A0ABU6RFB9_9FABA|nr:hypothetical protein [Stylosanthes scabra]